MYKVARSLAWAALLVSSGCTTQKPSTPPEIARPTTVTAEPQPPCETQDQAFRTLTKAHDLVATTTALTRLIEECPDYVTGPLRIRVSRVLYYVSEDQAQLETYFKTLGALFDIDWTAETEHETDFRWLSLAQRHIEHGDIALAQRVSKKIFEPGSLLQMRVDRRFDAVVSADPAHYDIRAAIDRSIERRHAASVSAPRSLSALLDYVQAVFQADKYAQALNIINEALTMGPTGYDDYVDKYPLLLTAKSIPLRCLGRMDETIEALRAAEHAGAGTRQSIVFTVNLADALERAGHAKEALETLAKVGDTSNYGSLILHVAIANTARRTGDVARADDALKKAGEYRWQNIRLYTNALMRAGRADEAKQQVLQLLELPYWRSRTLVDFQNYRQPAPRSEAEEFAAFRELAKLPEVHDAILKVGRIETFDFPPQ